MAAAKALGADHVVDFKARNPVEEVMRLTDGRGVDVAIEALGTQATFEAALRCVRPGGTLILRYDPESFMGHPWKSRPSGGGGGIRWPT